MLRAATKTGKLSSKGILSPWAKFLKYSIINHKFYYGQGAHLTLDLTNRHYSVSFQTIWEDYALVQISGLTGPKNFSFEENSKYCRITDSDLQQNYDEKIHVKLSIPQNLTYRAKVFGSMWHAETPNISSKVVGDDFLVDLVAPSDFKPSFEAATLQGTSVSISNKFGSVLLKSLLTGKAKINCASFEGRKLSIAQELTINTTSDCKIRSLIMQKSQTFVKSAHLTIESVMGGSIDAESDHLTINRLYGQKQGIRLKSKNYSVMIQSGTGTVQGQGDLKLGRMHKGKISDVSLNSKAIS